MAPPPIDQGEWDAVLELCRTETEDDCDYFYDYELDAEGCSKSLFWADTDSRMDFTDVVVFDTTCRTSKHGAAFVSRHRTPVVLGCGVTSDQSLDSLVWLLRAFTESNAQKRPASVITDASDAAAGAVKTVFPEANHRFCSGHLEKGIEEHLRGSPAAQTEFRACDHACSPAAFRDRWNGFMAKHRTAANQLWLDAMYRKRKMWLDGLPCRHIFCVMQHTSMSHIPDCCALRRMTRGLDAKNERVDEMESLGRQVFDLASEDVQEYQEIMKFFQTWLRDHEDRSRGPSAVAVEDDDGADAESSTLVANKKIKLFDD